MAVPLIIF